MKKIYWPAGDSNLRSPTIRISTRIAAERGFESPSGQEVFFIKLLFKPFLLTHKQIQNDIGDNNVKSTKID